MSNEEAELLARTTYRRMWRKFKKDLLYAIKILSLWFLCALAVFMVATAFECSDVPNTPLWIVLEAVTIVSAAVVSVTQVHECINQLKKSPRNGNSRRDIDKKSL